MLLLKAVANQENEVLQVFCIVFFRQRNLHNGSIVLLLNNLFAAALTRVAMAEKTGKTDSFGESVFIFAKAF